ncbi:unnamed protein product [Amoebophrya sp. A25]|nr:unnamed protein product [Amoebophrya sp. A25]|eukprot:GSA25T00014285001.1
MIEQSYFGVIQICKDDFNSWLHDVATRRYFGRTITRCRWSLVRYPCQ